MIYRANGVHLVLVITPLNFSQRPNFSYKPIHRPKYSELGVESLYLAYIPDGVRLVLVLTPKNNRTTLDFTFSL